MKRVAKVAAIASLFFICAVFVDVERADAQVVTSYYAPAPSVSYVPTRVGLFGWRRGYRPVVSYPSVVPAPVIAAPTVVAPTTTYYRAPVVVPSTTYYRAPVVAPPVTVYRPILPRRVYYAPAPVYVYP